ncbi:MAG: hypothetical protein P4M08_12885 [Oligoflexia bacterium]|nr:hypothetical protein [Oligoflexia bacterium]
MRLVEFLILVLGSHSETLMRLAALFEEENLVELLEMAGDIEQPPIRVPAEYFENPWPHSTPSDPYMELEGAVRDMKLPAVLQFHLWAYPYYRAFIESPLDLNARLPAPGGDAGVALAEDAIAQAEAWVRRLPMNPQVMDQACRAAQVPWLRFRVAVLKRVGRRPLGPVY